MGESLSLVSIFLAGILSYLSPCVIGIIPLYFSYLTQTTFSDLQQGQTKTKLLLKTLVLILGFSIFFVLLGAAASSVGTVLFTNKKVINIFISVFLIVFGIISMELIKPKFLSKQISFNFKINDSLITAFLLGIAFAFVMGPCASPILGAVLAVAASSATVSTGMLYLFIYSLGIGFPLLLTAFFIDKSVGFLRNNMHKLELAKKVAGAIMIILGIYLATKGSLSLYF